MVDPVQSNEPEEFWEPEMPAVWLVRNPEGFGVHGESSPVDQPVDLRLTYQQWLAIYLDALDLDKPRYEEWAAQRVVMGEERVVSLLTEFDEQIPGFPMLSRIRGPFYDAVFEADDVTALRQECLQVQNRTANPLALAGIKTLLLICDRAQNLKLSIYFVSDAS